MMLLLGSHTGKTNLPGTGEHSVSQPGTGHRTHFPGFPKPKWPLDFRSQATFMSKMQFGVSRLSPRLRVDWSSVLS
jgi:hypothetical protein